MVNLLETFQRFSLKTLHSSAVGACVNGQDKVARWKPRASTRGFSSTCALQRHVP